MTRWRIALAPIVAVLGLALAPAALGQAAGKTYRIGWLGLSSAATFRALHEAFAKELRDNGFEEGRNLTVERRYVEGHAERYAQFATELANMKVDLIVAIGSTSAKAAKDATRTIPIVMFGVANPERTGLVASLARPGGNLTGVSNMGVDVVLKATQLAKEALPHVSRWGVVWDPANLGSALAFKETLALHRKTGAMTISMPVGTAADLGPAFDIALRERAEALALDGTAVPHYVRIAKFAAEHRLPLIGPNREMAVHGALMSVGPDVLAQVRRTALLAVKILRGANPGALPIEQPTEIHIAINLKTAKALGLTVPAPLLLRADEVIE